MEKTSQLLGQSRNVPICIRYYSIISIGYSHVRLGIEIILMAGDGTIGLAWGRGNCLSFLDFCCKHQTSICMHPHLIKKVCKFAATGLHTIQ
jgi:hypothetical protein